MYGTVERWWIQAVGIIEIRRDWSHWIVSWWKLGYVCVLMTWRPMHMMDNCISDGLVLALLPFIPRRYGIGMVIRRGRFSGIVEVILMRPSRTPN